MLDFAIFAVTFVTFLVIVVFYLYPGSRRTGTTIPGLNPTDSKEGNVPDIQQCGSFHEFLKNLHQQHGPIASFWLQSQLAVSLGSPALFKEHQRVFHRPADIYSVFKPLMGANSLFYGSGTSSRVRHKALEVVFEGAMRDRYFTVYSELANEVIQKMESYPESQHIPLHQYMMALTIKTLLITFFGDQFKDTTKILDFRRSFDICCSDIDLKLQGKVLDDNEARKNIVDLAIQKVRSQLKEALFNLKTQETGMLKACWLASTYREGVSEENIDDALTIVFQGFQTSGNFLTWLLYYVATNPDVQSRLVNEIQSKLGNQKLTPMNLPKMRYLRQVLDETLRISNLVPFSTRYQDTATEIGGHIIPKRTPVIHAIGVVHSDPEIWASPEKFDPERFSEEQKVNRPELAFAPFDFSRTCPGEPFSMAFTSLFLVKFLRRRRIHLVEGQVVVRKYCTVTQPEDEIWITTSKRIW